MQKNNPEDWINQSHESARIYNVVQQNKAKHNHVYISWDLLHPVFVLITDKKFYEHFLSAILVPRSVLSNFR